MARTSKWTKEDRAKLWKMVKDGIPEQEIREKLAVPDGRGKTRPMSAGEFAQQLKQAMVEAGAIKQAVRKAKVEKKSVYSVTSSGRLTVTDFATLTGAKPGDKFMLEKPRGRSKAWRLVPVEG